MEVSETGLETNQRKCEGRKFKMLCVKGSVFKAPTSGITAFAH